MRSTRIVTVATALAVALTGLACGTKDATGPSLALSLEELGTLATELSDVMSASVLVRGSAPPARQFSFARARVAAVTTPFNTSWSCPAGGTASIASTYDTASTAMSGDATLSYSSCKTAHFTTSGSFHANGFDRLTQTGDTLQLTAGGSLTVTMVDGRSGVCPIDVTVHAGASGTATPVYVVSGYACGVKLTGSY